MPYYIKRKLKKKEKPLPLFDKAGIKIKKKPDLVAKLDKSSAAISGFVMQCQTDISVASRVVR